MTLPPGGPPYNPTQEVQQSSGKHSGASRKPLLIGLIVSALIVIGGGIAAAAFLTGKSTPSDDERISAAVHDFYETLSAKGPSVAVTKACAADRAEFDALPAAQKAGADRGKFTIRIVEVNQIVATADRATAQMTGALTMAGADDKTTTATEHLRKEDGAWKVCSTDGK